MARPILRTTPVREIATLTENESTFQEFTEAMTWDIPIRDKEGNPTEQNIRVWDNLTWRHFFADYWDWSLVWVQKDEDIDLRHAFVLALYDFKKNHGDSMSRIVTAFAENYAPLENYDKTIKETIGTKTEGKEESERKIDTETTFNSYSSTGDTTNSTNTHFVNTYENAMNKQDAMVTNNQTTTGDITSDGGSTVGTEEGGSKKTEGKEDVLRDYKEHGNIGVTTAQQMLQAEWELREKVNWEDYLLKMFARENLVLMP